MDRLALSHDLVRDVSVDQITQAAASRAILLAQYDARRGEGVDTPRRWTTMDLKRADTLGKAPSCFYYVETIEEMRALARELLARGVIRSRCLPSMAAT
ncbi:MAG: hypothetical protein ACLU37_08055 [Collinsella sp.]